MSNPTRDALIEFFGAVLPTPEDGQVFVAATPYPKNNSGKKPAMKHTYVETHVELADAVQQINGKGKEAYYALGRFMPHKTDKGKPGRQGKNVRGLKSFWVDIDCGEEKFNKGDGYLNQQDALTAIKIFATENNLPLPTHLVNSGGGIHAYWALDSAATPQEWQPIATKLKALAAIRGFHADPSRTDDLASILRPPGTQNHKLDNPRDVTIVRSKPAIKFSAFADAVISAHATHCGAIDSALGSNLNERDFAYTPENEKRIKQGLRTRTKEAGWNGREKWLDTMFAMRTLHTLAGWPNDAVWSIFDSWSKWVNAGDKNYDELGNRKVWDAPERKNGTLKTFASILDDAKPAAPAPLQPINIIGISAADLETKIFHPLKWVVDGVLPEGSYLLSARPKVGKSWLALQICLAVAYGDTLWGRQVQQGIAVYLALEDNERRLQTRLGQLRKNWGSPNLLLFIAWKRSDQGGLDDLEKLLADKKPRLVVIDTLAKIRPPSGRNGSAYEGDYQALAPITAMANKYRCCIVIVTHNRKGKADGDATEMVSGTLGQMGAVDGALVIDGNRGDATMRLTLVGRDIEEDGEFAIKKLPQGGWDWLGKADEVFISQERKAIIDLLQLGALKPKEIADRLGKQPATVRKMLFTMANEGQVTIGTDGRYAAP